MMADAASADSDTKTLDYMEINCSVLHTSQQISQYEIIIFAKIELKTLIWFK